MIEADGRLLSECGVHMRDGAIGRVGCPACAMMVELARTVVSPRIEYLSGREKSRPGPKNDNARARVTGSAATSPWRARASMQASERGTAVRTKAGGRL